MPVRLFLTLIAISLAVCAAFVLACQTRDLTAPRALAEPLPEVTSAKKSGDEITIAAVGDVMLGSPFPNDSRMPPNDGADLLKDVTPVLSAADIAFGNMEGPITDGGVSEKCSPPKPVPPGQTPPPVRCFAFRMPTRYAKYLKDAGFDVMSVANNHASDFGDAGRASTRRTLDALVIKHAGSDRENFSTAYLDVKGRKVAVVGFAHNAIVPNVNDLDTARHLVAVAAKNADIVIVSFHGGAEGTGAQHVPKQTEIFLTEKRGNLPLFARTVIDAGADLVLGHGPHVMRGLEIYKDRLICYSLGNFATYGWFSLKAETALTEILEVRLAPDGKFAGGRIHAAKQLGLGGPVLDPTGESIRVVRDLSTADFPASAPKIADDGTIETR